MIKKIASKQILSPNVRQPAALHLAPSSGMAPGWGPG